jgi:hypothetical protein
MEMYFSVWTFVLFICTIFIAILGFSLMQQSMNKILRQMDQQRARQDEFWKRQDEIWQQLFAKADNTERLTQEILTRLAPRDSVH